VRREDLARLGASKREALTAHSRLRGAAVAAAEELLAAGFSDPEGWYYLGRQMAHAGESDRALRALSRSVDEGWFGVPALESDPWLDSLCGDSRFQTILAAARQRHAAAKSAFEAEGGPQLLGDTFVPAE